MIIITIICWEINTPSCPLVLPLKVSFERNFSNVKPGSHGTGDDSTNDEVALDNDFSSDNALAEDIG